MMPGLTMPKKRGGIFGSVAQPLAATPAAALPIASEPPAPQRPKFFGEGGPGRDIAGAMADFAAQYFGGQGMYAPAMEHKRQMQAQETNRLRDFANQRSLIDYKRANPDPDYFYDNAGNRWAINPSTGEKKLIFRDPNAKRIPQKVTGPNGEEFIEYVEIPNNVNEDGTFRTAATSGPQPGAIEDGHRFKGGNPADPSSWEPVGGSGPPGIGSAPQAPTIMTRAQYQGFVQSMGKTAADAFLRRNGLSVGNN